MCHFMVKEGIVLGHKVSGSRIKVDKAKIEAISKLPYPINVKSIQSFLGHAGFYKRFIKDFLQVARPMTQLLVKDAQINFSEECIQAFDKLKHKLTQALIIIKPDWSLSFEVMGDASDYVVGLVLGQMIDKHFKPIHYVSKTMSEAQENYPMIKKELLVVVFAFNKFCQYLVLCKTIIFTDHSTLRYLFTKQDAKLRLIRLILLHQEFDIEIRDKKCAKNLTADHLSCLENPDLGKLSKAEIRDLFPEEQLMAVSDNNNKSCALTKSYEGASPKMRQHKSFDNVTVAPHEGIMVLALGWHLEKIHMTWAHLEKKQTRLLTYTKSLKESCLQCVETASQPRTLLKVLLLAHGSPLRTKGRNDLREKESKALKLIKASNNRKRKAYESIRAIAYMKICKTQGEDNVQASPNYKAKIKTQTSSTVVFIFATMIRL
uniref:Reverse transcriptase domain-containing protein n=1 Tax=Tanacetum cinerariifolium TaxID=118510 RepID=A0A6L2J5E2_TANCI|nr:reverse transcriptase domain-containing protein [Tanacetum cinerariifolium]